MREILGDSQRTHFTPPGQRSSSRCILHFSSLSNLAISLARFVSGLKFTALGTGELLMQEEKRTPASKMTTEEAMNHLCEPAKIDCIRELTREDETTEDETGE